MENTLKIGQQCEVVEILQSGTDSYGGDRFKTGGHTIKLSNHKCLMNGTGAFIFNGDGTLYLEKDEFKVIGRLKITNIK